MRRHVALRMEQSCGTGCGGGLWFVLAGACPLVAAAADEVAWRKMPLRSPEAEAAGVNAGGDGFTTLTAPLPAGADFGQVTQIQLQGVNWSDGAAPLKLAVSRIGLCRSSGEAK